MDEKSLTEKALLFKKEGWEVSFGRHFPGGGGCVVSVYVRRPGSSHQLLLGKYQEAADIKTVASIEE